MKERTAGVIGEQATKKFWKHTNGIQFHMRKARWGGQGISYAFHGMEMPKTHSDQEQHEMGCA